MPLIRRTQPTSDRLPPWHGLTFTDAVGTDAFYEHLQKTYPNSTQWERKHMAAIDFLIWELRQEQSLLPSHDQSQRSLASPDMSIHPNDGESSHDDTPASSPTSSEFLEVSVSKNDAHPTVELREPPLSIPRNATATTDGMTQYVFSATDLQTHEPRKRRKMSPAEKKAYKRMRRRGGACDKCRKNKEKCVHNLVDQGPPRELDSSKETVCNSNHGQMANQDKSTSSRVFGDSQAKEALSAHAAHGASRPVLVNANEARMSPCHVTQSNLDSRWNGNLHGAVSDDTGYVNHPLQSSSAYHGTPWIPLEQIDGQLAHYSIPEGHQPSPPYQDPTTEHFGYQPIQDDYSEGPWPSFLVPPD